MDIKTTCLGVLALGEASGYEIRKEFEEGPFSHFAEGGFGSIYPALNRLEDEGLATCMARPQDKRPDKKVYRITEAGWDHLEARMREKVPGEDKYKSDLLFILFFSDWQDPTWIARVIDARIDWYRDKIAMMEACSDTLPEVAGRRLVHGFGLTVYSAALGYLEEHRDAFVASAGRPRAARPAYPSAAE
jgi:PadR family transcriptional regulator AphA